MTKRDKPAMSEEEFDEAIKELARKEFATGKGMMMLIEIVYAAWRNSIS